MQRNYDIRRRLVTSCELGERCVEAYPQRAQCKSRPTYGRDPVRKREHMAYTIVTHSPTIVVYVERLKCFVFNVFNDKSRRLMFGFLIGAPTCDTYSSHSTNG